MSAESQRIGRYVVRELLAEGGTAELFLAQGPDGSVRCVKRMRRELCESAEFVADFVSAADAAVTLRHPNIVRVHEWGEDDGHYFVAMDVVEGPTLSRLLARHGRLAPDLVATVGAELARALEYIHHADPASGRRQPLIHCDVNPQNVLIDGSGAVKLADFGIAKAIAGTGASTFTGERGKVGYFAPEQLDFTSDGRNRITSGVDLFALGLVLWHALVGTHPYVEGCPPGSMLAMWLPDALAGNRRRRVADAAPMAPAGLCAAIESLLQPLEQRTPTAAHALSSFAPFTGTHSAPTLGRLAASTPREHL